jgi:probable HAF family extracellular repeat protein
MQDLGFATGWTGAFAADINESGQVAGFAETDVGQRAVLWTVSVDAGGAVQVFSRESLGTLPDGGSSVAFGVNNLGQVAGYAYYPASGPNRAVLWTRTSTGWMIEDLDVLPGDMGSTAYGVNDQGQVVGVSMPQQGCFHAVLWTTQGGRLTGMRALETAGGCSAEAWAINNQSQIVGRLTNNGRSEASMWSLAADGSTASTKSLGRLSGTASSLAIGLSANVGGLTEVAGLSRATFDDRATLWTVK